MDNDHLTEHFLHIKSLKCLDSQNLCSSDTTIGGFGKWRTVRLGRGRKEGKEIAYLSSMTND